MRTVVGKKALKRRAASSQTVARFETEILPTEENIQALSEINHAWVKKATRATKAKKIILDMDSSESPVHGNQEGSAYNGHFLSRCYHPLFVFNQFGDCEGAILRPGNVHSADGWKDLLEPIVDRYRETDKKLYFGADAATCSPDVYEYLEEEGILYAIRIKASSRLYDQSQGRKPLQEDGLLRWRRLPSPESRSPRSLPVSGPWPPLRPEAAETKGQIHMKHPSSSQAFPKTAETCIFHATAGRSIMGKGKDRGLDVSTFLRAGRIMASGGGYGKYRIRRQGKQKLLVEVHEQHNWR